MGSSHSSYDGDWRSVLLGDVTQELTIRLGESESDQPVYGVDRMQGLTPTPKYQASDLTRYKKIESGMFAYNPMRLNIGSIGYCSDRHRPGVVSPDYVVFGCVQDHLAPDYLYWLTKSGIWSEWVENAGVGSVRVRIYFRELKRMPLRLPLLDEQHAIAEVLGSLDDKIERNRRTARTLERLARAIFRAWFIDFEPVKAKAAGATSFPSMPQDVFDSLPSTFTDSELGPIPAGWLLGSVGDVVFMSKLQVDPSEAPNETFEHFSIPAFDGGRQPILESGATIKSNKFLVPNDCVLLSKLNPRIPRVWVPFTTSGLRRVASTEFLPFGPTGGADISFLFACFTQPDFGVRLSQRATGTSNSHQRVRPQDILSDRLALPAEAVLKTFGQIASPLLAMADQLEHESRKLAEMRDFLLPKLLSGQVRVNKARRFAEEAI